MQKLFTHLHISLLIFGFSTFLCTNAFAQFNLASDNASNAAYSGGFGGTQNGGTGFNAWSFTYGSNTGSFKGNPANDGMGTTNIGTNAFGFFATGNQYVNALRTFSALQFNDELSFYWAMNFDASSGAKGFDLKNGGNTIFNVNNGGNTNITTNNGTVTTTYGTTPMLVKVLRTTGNNYSFSMTSKSGGATYSTTFTSASALDGYNIYSGNQNDGAGQRNIYFNNFAINNSGIFNIVSGSETYTKSFTGTGTLTKSGAGSLILTGTHTYTGDTTINAGTIQLGDSGATGSITSNITNNASLIINRSNNLTYSGVISGTGSLTKQGVGTLILGGDNTFTGGTTVSAGTIQFGTGGSSIGSVTGTILNNSAVIFNRSGSITSNVIISGTGTVTKQGSSTLTFIQPHTYTGVTIINAGNLRLDKSIANSDVIVNTGATLTIIGDDVKLKSLTVNVGGFVVINPGKSLNITGNLSVNGSMTLESTSVTYSSLIVDGTTSGNVIYKRHTNINSSVGGNDLISAPVSGQPFGAFAMGNGNLVTDPGNSNRKLFGPFNKSTGTFQIYDTSIDGNTSLSPGLGYRAATSDNSTLSFTGIINTGTIPQPISVSGPQFAPWNLIGNPYPSYLYVKEGTGANPHPGFLNTNASLLAPNYVAIYGYDNDTSDGSNYTIWNLANTTSTTTMTPGQGFFVVSGSSGGTINFTPGMRATGTSDDFIEGRQTEENNALLKLKITNGTSNYVTDFYFNDAGTLGLDPGYDAGVFGGNAPGFSIYSQLVEEGNNVQMAIQSLPYSTLNSEVIIPIGINASQGQQISLSVTETTISPEVDVYLEDTFTGISKLLNSGNYIFTTNSNLTGFGRFYLRFSNSTLSNSFNELDSIEITFIQSSKILRVSGHLKSDSLLNIYDLQGRLVVSSTLNSSLFENQVDVSNVSMGAYVVILSSESAQTTKKIIIR